MGTMTVRNLPDEVHRRVKFVAVQRGISTKAAARELLDEATRPVERVGDIIADFVKRMKVDFPEIERSQEPLEAADFE